MYINKRTEFVVDMPSNSSSKEDRPPFPLKHALWC